MSDTIRQNEQYSIYLFGLTYLFSIPFTLLDLTNYGEKIGLIELVYWVNHIFVQKYGYFWFTVAYLGNIFTYLLDGRVPTRIVSYFLQKYSINTLVYILLTIWCFGELIIERINMWTGGHCVQEMQIINDPKRCSELMLPWINGFDLSGHYYFIVSTSMLLFPETIRVRALCVTGKSFGINRKFLKTAFILLTLILLAIWFSMFVVTSLFFHTILEKTIGILMGVVIPLVIRHIDFPNDAVPNERNSPLETTI